MKNLENIKAYVQATVGGIGTLATVLLVVLQWGNASQFSLYGKNLENVNTAVLIILSAAGGFVLLYMVRITVHGSLAIFRKRRLAEKMKRP